MSDFLINALVLAACIYPFYRFIRGSNLFS